MWNCISTISDHCLNEFCQWLKEKGRYYQDREKNLDSLNTTMVALKAKRVDLSTRLKKEEDRGRKKLSEIQVWLDRVETIEKEVNHLLRDREIELQKWYVCGFCYGYGEKVFLTLKEVQELYNKVFEEIVYQPLTPEVEERQLPPIMVRQGTMLDKAWKHLMEDGVGIMGIYGMGGVGKTTLLKQINNEFCKDRCGFDYVIWVTVSKELHVENILDKIAQKVSLGGEEWNKKDKSEKADCLFNFLNKKRFMLFLDDIWKKVDLTEIGVPDPRKQKGCKVAFTTRNYEVCLPMGVKEPMEVQCLAEDEAFDLFQKIVGQVTLRSDPGIPGLARIVAKKCSGLPLALNIIGETMSSKRKIQEWKYAIKVLDSNAAQHPGMKEKILPILKYSYDSLEGDQLKSCLLYCALYPEDYKIRIEDLIEYWICERIIDGSEDIDNAENEGYSIIGSLGRASLLMEEVDQNEKDVVYMHDVVREMALWIASDLEKQTEAFIVRVGFGLSEIPKVKNWKVVRRMSLMHNRISHLPGSPECLELTTLLLQENRVLSTISSEFFKSMPKLVVLDISGNHNLFELPDEISKLVSLQYLNLSDTPIQELSKGLQELKKLIHLNLEKTRQLQSIVGISSLHNLKVLKLHYSGLLWDLDMVRELEALEHLEILTVNFNHGRKLEQFLSSHKLISCTQSLWIERRGNAESSGISSRETMYKLRELRIYDCDISKIELGTIKMDKLRKLSFSSLVKVSIVECYWLRELTFLMFAPNLRFLQVKWAHDLEDIINKKKARQVENSEMILPFEKLNELHLFCVRKLKNIYWSPLPFPYLQTITINLCPNLKKLPLDSKSGKHGENGLIIKYEETEWIEGVEWEDEATKTRFLSSCRCVKFDFMAKKSWRLG